MKFNCTRCNKVSGPFTISGGIIIDDWCESCIKLHYYCPFCKVTKLDDNGDICVMCSKRICHDCLNKWEHEEEEKEKRNETATYYMLDDHNICKDCHNVT